MILKYLNIPLYIFPEYLNVKGQGRHHFMRFSLDGEDYLAITNNFAVRVRDNLQIVPNCKLSNWENILKINNEISLVRDNYIKTYKRNLITKHGYQIVKKALEKMEAFNHTHDPFVLKVNFSKVKFNFSNGEIEVSFYTRGTLLSVMKIDPLYAEYPYMDEVDRRTRHIFNLLFDEIYDKFRQYIV